ncbi:MAG TPA: asparagine synthase-related protein [Candidatus Kapabacteria bacterium]|nr:asparagine synthase-related protein [Candidatus Kapabacteria bacterium]
MSWIIGASGEIDRELKNTIELYANNPLYKFVENNLFVLAGGYQSTCNFSKSERTNENLLSVGIGIKNGGDDYGFVKNDEWFNYASQKNYNALDGHYVILYWNELEIKVFTDKLGLRDLYLYNSPQGYVIFSTRLDWLAKIVKAKLNFKVFASKWLLFNQLSTDCIFNDIERITSGTTLNINRITNNLSIQKNNWTPILQKRNFSPIDFSNKLENLLIFPIRKHNQISLSLSGGLDSRVLLSFLMKIDNSNWETHTFGDRKNADSIIVEKIASSLNIPHIQIDLPLPDPSTCLDEMRAYISQTILNSQASEVLQLRNYSALSGRNEVIIDGGFGEIWRRDFFNRLLYSGYKDLLNRNARSILPHLKYDKADIFTPDINAIMHKGAIEQIESLFEELPAIELIGAENWIDLFAIKTRLRNYYANEQSRIDSLIFGYMPFAQSSLLENLFNLNIIHRKNGKLFKYLVSKNYNKLTKYPLSKGDAIYPFWFNTYLARIWKILSQHHIIKSYKNENQKNIIEIFSTFILDKINSREVKECEYYDYSKLIKLANALRNNKLDKTKLNEIDWWLSFELFRENKNYKKL